MGRKTKLLFNLLFIAILAPLLKIVADEFTEPVTGILVTMGVPEAEIGIVGAVPWIVPLFVLIWTIIQFSKPEEPKYPTGGTIR